MSVWEVYFLGMADSLKFFLCATSFLASCLFGIWWLAYVNSDALKPPKYLSIAIVVFFMVQLMPSSKTIALMYTLPAITQNENFKALPNDVAAFLRKVIQEYDKK